MQRIQGPADLTVGASDHGRLQLRKVPLFTTQPSVSGHAGVRADGSDQREARAEPHVLARCAGESAAPLCEFRISAQSETTTDLLPLCLVSPLADLVEL